MATFLNITFGTKPWVMSVTGIRMSYIKGINRVSWGVWKRLMHHSTVKRQRKPAPVCQPEDGFAGTNTSKNTGLTGEQNKISTQSDIDSALLIALCWLETTNRQVQSAWIVSSIHALWTLSMSFAARYLSIGYRAAHDMLQ